MPYHPTASLLSVCFFLTDYLARGIVYDEHPSASFPVQKGIAPPLRLGGRLVRDDTAFRVLPAPAPPGISVADVQYLTGAQAEACEMEVVCHPGYVPVLVIVVSPELCRKKRDKSCTPRLWTLPVSRDSPSTGTGYILMEFLLPSNRKHKLWRAAFSSRIHNGRSNSRHPV